jgi:predicted Zn-dependent protease
LILYFFAVGQTLRFLLFLFPLVFLSCSLSSRIPTISDDRLERLVREEAYRILQVTQDRDAAESYTFLLSDFPRKDILGLSVGGRRIYVSYQLASHALKNSWSRWQLRQTLAHEIAHEISGHAHDNITSFNQSVQGYGVTGKDVGLPGSTRFRSYSVEKELEADLRGMKYWRDLKWNCQIWVKILEGFKDQNYPGDIFHPTGERLRQALNACPSPIKKTPLA